MTLYHGQTFEHKERTFRIEIEPDDMGAPWEWSDGHGIVSEWTRRNKRAGERILIEDRGSKRYYDIQGTMAIAKRDGWGIAPEERQKLEQTKGKPLTKGEIITLAVERDYQYLKGWCDGNWEWVYILVTLLDEDGKPTEYFDSLGGMDSNDNEGIEHAAHNLAKECLREYGQWLAKVTA